MRRGGDAVLCCDCFNQLILEENSGQAKIATKKSGFVLFDTVSFLLLTRNCIAPKLVIEQQLNFTP